VAAQNPVDGLAHRAHLGLLDIVNVALPSIATDLGASDSSLEWVVAGYGLTFAAFLITAGRLGDDLGRRRVNVTGLALFTRLGGLWAGAQSRDAGGGPHCAGHRGRGRDAAGARDHRRHLLRGGLRPPRWASTGSRSESPRSAAR
jgi:Major Facilitator Superfamily